MPASAVIRQAGEADLPVIEEIITAAYSRYLPRMDRPPAPMLRERVDHMKLTPRA